MRLTVNGEVCEVPDLTTVAGLIEVLSLPAERLAVERNREVVRRKDWDSTQLADGDRLEIIHFVGGG